MPESMSDSMSSGTDLPDSIDNTRQPAQRLSAAELNTIAVQVTEAPDDDADDDVNQPNLALTETGGAVNRVLMAGVCTEIIDTSNDDSDPYYRARIITPTGTVFAYAGQYQPDARAWLQSVDADADLPQFVMVVGKLRLLEQDEGDVFTAIQPEWIRRCSETQRNRWVVEMAEDTLDRIEQTQRNDDVSADGVPKAVYDHHGVDLSEDTLDEYVDIVIEALEDIDYEPAPESVDAGEPPVGEALRERRTEVGLSQAEFAERVGVAKSTVGGWERGESDPDEESREALASTLAEIDDRDAGAEAEASGRDQVAEANAVAGGDD